LTGRYKQYRKSGHKSGKVMPNYRFIDYSGQSIDVYQVDRLLVRHKIYALYLARNKNGTPVFMELLNSTAEQDPELDGRFQQQMRVFMQHRHPGIATVLRVGYTGNNHAYAVSQYSAGSTLAQHLEEWRKTGLTFSILGALQLVKHLAQALAVAHPLEIFHHDLRPDHIILDENNILVLTGLGVPYQPEPPQPIKQVDTLDYLSPEQQQGKPINGRSNIYSLGIILYELLAGHRPEIPLSAWDIFEITALPKASPIEEARPGLTAATHELVNTCLWRQEWYRYETVDQFIAAIDAAIAAETSPARPLPEKARFPRWLYTAVPLGALLLALASFLLVRGNAAPEVETPLPVTAVTTPPPDTPSPQPTRPATPTTGPPKSSPTSETPILLLFPGPGVAAAGNEAVHFDWSYPLPLEPDQRFTVQIITAAGAQTLGAVSRPVSGQEYRLFVNLADWNLNSGIYQWFVVLETGSSGEELLHSSQQPVIIQAAALTATPVLTLTTTLTPEIVTTQLTQIPPACTPAPPANWVVYTVKEGDYLFNLALATGTTVERLQAVNCLLATGLGIGKRLWLPILPPTATPAATPTAVPTTAPSGGGSGPTQPEPTKTPPPPPN
jgi:serine/threonine protein kinase